MMVLAVLDDGPQRFNTIKRRLEGVTQKALTQCLRRLERNGLVSRQVISFSPVAVQYQITPLGRTLQQPFKALHEWTLEQLPQVEAARRRFDQMSSGVAPPAPPPGGRVGVIQRTAIEPPASSPDRGRA